MAWHGNQGRAKAWALGQATRSRIVELARNNYAGFNDSHLTEQLVEVEKIAVSRETVRRLLRKSGMRSSHKSVRESTAWRGNASRAWR